MDISLRDGEEGCLLPLTVRPGASRSRVVGEHGGRLKVSVQAPPERGRANRAVVKLIASVLELRAADLEIVRGHTSKDKDLLVRGLEASELGARLEALAD